MTKAPLPKIDIGDPAVRDTDLCRRDDIARWLMISVSMFDVLRREGRAPKPCTPETMRPKWRVGDVRSFYNRQERDPIEKTATESKSEPA